MSRRPSARTRASDARSPMGSSANVRRGGEDIPRTASPGFMDEIHDEINFDNYKLPHAVEVAMNSWIENSNSMAVIMTLFAAVQIILIQILPSFKDNAAADGNNPTGGGGGGNSSTPATPLWRSTSFFMYCGIFLHLGGAISAVVIINMAATLPIKGRHLALTDEESFAYKVFVSKELYQLCKRQKGNNKNKHDRDDREEENEDHDDHDDKDHGEKPIPIPIELLENENDLLEEWGLGRKFRLAGIHMSICFVLGFLASFLSVMLWVWSWEPTSYATKIGGALVPVLLAGGLTFCFVLTG